MPHFGPTKLLFGPFCIANNTFQFFSQSVQANDSAKHLAVLLLHVPHLMDVQLAV